jgi:tetratricopeptide (TPR) repeat protein
VSSQADSASQAEVFQQGVQAIKTGDLEAAEAAFRRVIELDPGSSASHINLAVTYMREKRWADALTQLHQAEALSPGEAGIKLNLGLVYYRQNNFASAIGPLSAALQGTPDSLQARYLLGLCYFFTGNYKQAASTLVPLWQQESTNLNYLYVLSIAAGKSANVALQHQAFDQMLSLGHDQPEFHLYLGKAWLAQDNTAKALKEFQLAAASHPNLSLVHYFLGRTLLMQHDYLRAKAEFLELRRSWSGQLPVEPRGCGSTVFQASD